MHEVCLKQLQRLNSKGAMGLLTRIEQHSLSAHETDLNTHDDDEYNSEITTEDNLMEHNFINHKDIINFNTSVNNQNKNN